MARPPAPRAARADLVERLVRAASPREVLALLDAALRPRAAVWCPLLAVLDQAGYRDVALQVAPDALAVQAVAPDGQPREWRQAGDQPLARVLALSRRYVRAYWLLHERVPPWRAQAQWLQRWCG